MVDQDIVRLQDDGVYGFLAGGALGWTFALLRNTVLLLYVAIVRRRVELGLLRRFLEFV